MGKKTMVLFPAGAGVLIFERLRKKQRVKHNKRM